MGKIKKKEEVFFELFSDFCDEIVKAGETFKDMIVDYTEVKHKADRMKGIETDCDMKAHAIDDELRKSFVTPFDREDIYALARQLDDIVDCMEEVANRFYIFNVSYIRPEAVEMANQIVRSIKQLKEAFHHLPNIKKDPAAMMENVILVNDIENEGDVVFRSAIKRLFDEEKDPIELIKWKHIFEQIEESLDSCEAVANILEGIVVKYV